MTGQVGFGLIPVGSTSNVFIWARRCLTGILASQDMVFGFMLHSESLALSYSTNGLLPGKRCRDTPGFATLEIKPFAQLYRSLWWTRGTDGSLDGQEQVKRERNCLSNG